MKLKVNEIKQRIEMKMKELKAKKMENLKI
jgi:hypothetical protein